jgi:hypothetical protein
MKNILLSVLLCFCLVTIGCNAQTTANVAESAITVALNIASAELPAIPLADQASYAGFISGAQNINGQLGVCIEHASGVMSKASKFLVCFNAFAAGLVSPAELAQLHVLSPATQQKVQIYVTAVVTAVNIAVVAYGGSPVPAPTVVDLTPASQAQVASLELTMQRAVGL